MKREQKRIIKIFAVTAVVSFFAIVLALSLALYKIGSYDTVSKDKVEFGVTFSKPFSEMFAGIDWKENYLAVLDDLKVKKIRLPAYWDQIEKEKGVFIFDDLDWQIEEAEKRGVEIILAVGRRLPRWPECHLPEWARLLEEKETRERILAVIREVVGRYKDNGAIKIWQVENEPFLKYFGECPETDPDFLDKEILLVKIIDSEYKRPILISDSGEFGLWMKAAGKGDVFGTTMYRVVFTEIFGQITYPLPPAFFRIKNGALKIFHGLDKRVMTIELQAEPWGHLQLYETPLSTHMESMDHNQFLHNLEYAKRVGFKENYLWGAEWWYWVKQTQNDSFYWEEAKKLFIK